MFYVAYEGVHAESRARRRRQANRISVDGFIYAICPPTADVTAVGIAYLSAASSNCLFRFEPFKAPHSFGQQCSPQGLGATNLGPLGGRYDFNAHPPVIIDEVCNLRCFCGNSPTDLREVLLYRATNDFYSPWGVRYFLTPGFFF